ncbi:MAG TPA: hypothetical protein VLT32_15030 [Candidatus Sulfomarinibacteraceae bacterium]|nr:hypothetical protein [Candidatus Sulfomarinibacteraceae bacterium]
MDNVLTCGGCGADLPPRTTICPECGWDLGTALSVPPRRTLLQQLGAGGWRLLVYGAILLLPLVGFARLRETGPGPDLATTLRWMAVGDDGRAAELVTLHRMYEIGSAASRYAVRETEAFPFEGEWGRALAPMATMNVRGWIQLVIFGSDADSAPASVREFYEVRDTDGWGRPYRVETRVIDRDEAWREDPVVRADLELGLHETLFREGLPDLGRGDWLRLELTSAGSDGTLDTDDDLRFVSYSLASAPLQMLADPRWVVERIERNYERGPQFFRIEGSEHDLIDARLLAEFRLTSLH